MKLNPEIEIVERHIEQADQRLLNLIPKLPAKKRKNNRKNTRGRNTQYIRQIVKGTFPPVFITKCIKS